MTPCQGQWVVEPALCFDVLKTLPDGGLLNTSNVHVGIVGSVTLANLPCKGVSCQWPCGLECGSMEASGGAEAEKVGSRITSDLGFSETIVCRQFQTRYRYTASASVLAQSFVWPGIEIGSWSGQKTSPG